MDITVVICTYNGANRLPHVLDCLASQVFTASVTWEIVVVNNNSSDETAQVIQHYCSLPAFVDKLRYAFELKQGVAFARRRAVRVAKGKQLAFLDDDNLPVPNWLQAIYDFGLQHPQAGAYGSQIVARYEVEPPPEFERIACFLAVIDRGNQPFRYDLLNRWLFPAGAGLVVNRQAWLAHVPDQPILSGVMGQTLSGKGEDIETLSYLRHAGWQIWHNPDMQIEHVIGGDRLNPGYLLALFQGVGLSRYHTRMIRFHPWQRPFVTIAYGCNDFRRLVTLFIHHSRETQSIVNTCERTLLFYSLLSPFHAIYQVLAQRVANQNLTVGLRITSIDSS